MQGSAVIKSVGLGKTQLICRDHKNHNNWDAIDIEVTQLNQFTWIEEQVEIKAAATQAKSDQAKAFGEIRVLSLVALDSKGRKFTNCTSVRPDYELKGETFVRVSENYDSQSRSTKYDLLKHFVGAETNQELISTSQRFDEQPAVTYSKDLKTEGTPILTQILMKHNNFGICAQTEVQGLTEGLARVKASFVVHDYVNGPGRLLASEFAQIAVYNPLVSVQPLYAPFMSDLYSVNQLGQEFQSFEGFYEDWKLNLQFGSSIGWRVTGGSNFWPDQVQNYLTSWKSDSKVKMFDLTKIKVYASESDFEVTCLTPDKDDKSSQRSTLTVNQASRSSRTLLRPAEHTVTV